MTEKTPTSVERPQPYSIEAEEAVLGSLLMDSDRIADVTPFLRPSDFYREKHQWIYEALTNLYDRGEPADMLTVVDELERMERLSDVGGPAAINEFVLNVPTAIHAEHYGRIVERKAVYRRLVQAAERIAQLAYKDTDADVDDVVATAEQILFDATERAEDADLIPIREAVREAMDDIVDRHAGADPEYTPTPFEGLNRYIGGWHAGDLVLLGARPSIGKTALSLKFVLDACLTHDAKAAYFSMEMKAVALAKRLLSNRSGADSQRIRLGPVDDNMLESTSAAADVLQDLDLMIDETSGLTFHDIRRRARRAKHAMGGLDIVVVDYAQIMQFHNSRSKTHAQQIGDTTRDFKGLAQNDLDATLILNYQLKPGEHRPTSDDLRDSKAPLNDSDIVILLHNNEQHEGTDWPHQDDKTHLPKVEGLLIKQRQGPRGMFPLVHNKRTNEFADWDTRISWDDAQQSKIEDIDV